MDLLKTEKAMTRNIDHCFARPEFWIIIFLKTLFFEVQI